MQVNYSTELNKNVRKYFDNISASNEVHFLKTDSGKKIVLMSSDYYSENLNATAQEKSNSSNQEILNKAIEDVEAGKTFNKELIDL